MLDLKQYQEYIRQEYLKFPHASLDWLTTILRTDRYNLPTKRKKGEYEFIPISGYNFIYVLLFTKLYATQYYKKTKYYIKFIDLGAGNGQTSVITSTIYVDYLGIEKYPLKKYNTRLIKKGDFLKINTFEGLGDGRKIYYAYNPLKDGEMMYNALEFWIVEVLKKGDILIYIKTSYFEQEYEKIFNQQFKNLIGNIYIYEKE